MWLSSYSSVDDCKLDIRNHLLIKVGKNVLEKDLYSPIYLLMGHWSCASRCAGDSQIWWKQGNSVTNSSDWEILGFTIFQYRICKRGELDVNITISSNQRQIEWNQTRLEKIECNQNVPKRHWHASQIWFVHILRKARKNIFFTLFSKEEKSTDQVKKRPSNDQHVNMVIMIKSPFSTKVFSF